ncbi:MAG TPA: spermidine/putrescine ABC transporter substrate-binding protein [Candidatus Limnocylindrales bacterium]|nr:spermidine/putrescine ABC transporter substrate-binding protein [Candidatus Limnocylindrales bacterium]
MADRDLGELLARMARTRVNRRSFLATSGLLGTSAYLAACSTGGGGTSAPTGVPASQAPGGEATPAPASEVESELFVYNWSDYISPNNIEAFKEEFGVTNFVYDIFSNNEELIAKLQGGASGYDLACPTAEYVPGMVEEGFLTKLDLSRIPNVKHINPTFKGLWWDPTDEYQVPKDYGTTGILWRKSLLPSVPASWKEFYELVKGEGSGKTVFVDSMGDVFVFPLKMLGYSLNSNEPNELEEARKILLEVAPHILALDSDTYGDKMATGEAALTLGWTGPLGQELADLVAEGDAGYSVPSEGTLFWMDTWVMLADAPHPNAAYAWLDFIHRPEIQAEETNYNLYATPNDAAKEFVDPEILNNPAIFPPEDVIANLEGAQDTSGNNQRIDIWEEFKSAIGG